MNGARGRPPAGPPDPVRHDDRELYGGTDSGTADGASGEADREGRDLPFAGEFEQRHGESGPGTATGGEVRSRATLREARTPATATERRPT